MKTSVGIFKLQLLQTNVNPFWNFFSVISIFGYQNPGSGSESGPALTKNAGTGSALKTMRIHNTV
jgi:hypothetical protein